MDELGVLCQYAAFDAEGGLHPGGLAFGEFGIGDVERQGFLLRVDGDRIAVVDQGDRATHPGFWGNVANHKAVRAAAEATVRDEADAIA